MKLMKFHQFIHLEKGPVNTAIVDFLKGDVYQIGGEFVDKFLEGKYEEIPDFIRMLEEEELCFETEPGAWIPYIKFEEVKEDSIELEIEIGSDIEMIRNRFMDYSISISELIPGENDFSRCKDLVKCNGVFGKIYENMYWFNMNYNSCWGKKITVMKDGAARLCIHSLIILGNVFKDDVNMIVDKAKGYWKLTKDKVEKCKECELRYICFDCREIPIREEGALLSKNIYCLYDPSTGIWEQSGLNSGKTL